MKQFWKSMLRNPGGMIGLVILTIAILVALFGPWLAHAAVSLSEITRSLSLLRRSDPHPILADERPVSRLERTD